MSKESGIGTSIAGPSVAVIKSSDTETDSSSDGSFISPPAKKPKVAQKHRKQFFCPAWLKDPQFQLWLQKTDDPLQAKCTVCVKFLTATRTVLKNHANTMRHSTNMQRNARALISVPSVAAATSIDTSVAGPSSEAFISSDAKNDSRSDNTFAVPAKKKIRRQQAFREAWLEEPEFKLWLERVEDNPYKARCRVCCKRIIANKTDLSNHANSNAHITNMQHREEPLTSTGERSFTDQVKLAEITVCMDAVEHDRSFESYCHFIEMLKNALPNPDILQHISLNKNKMRAIVKNDINKYIIAESTERLQGKCFSDIHKTDVEKEENLLALETIYPDSNCLNTPSEIENSNGEGDHKKITKFDQSAFENILKTMPFDEIFLDSLDFLNPAIALDLNRHRKDHLASILKEFESKKLNEAAVKDEWRLVACFSADEDKEKLRALSVPQFWHHIGSLQYVSDGSYKFKNISQLAQLCLSLPHSSADVE